MSEAYRGHIIEYKCNADGQSDFEEWWEVGGQAFDTLDEAKLFVDTVLVR